MRGGRGRGDSAERGERAARNPVALQLPAMSAFSGHAVAAVLRQTLERLGAGATFGLPGGPNRELFLALRGSSVRLVVPSHELAAAFMAGGYGRVSGRPGVLLTIPGPGFAYALAGIAEAWQDSAPLVHIVAAPPEPPHQRLRHQALDQTAIAAPMVKAVFSVGDPARLASDLADAFDTAQCGEPGPVLLQLGAAPSRTAQRPLPADERELAAVWQRIARARRPVLYLGQGCARAATAVRRYAERTGTPVFSTASGRGVLSEAAPLSLAYDSLRGTTYALNDFLSHCDLVLAVGARLAYNGTAGFGLQLPAERLVHVDASGANLNALYPAAAVLAVRAEEFFAHSQAQAVPRSQWSAAELAAARAAVGSVLQREAEPVIAADTPVQFFSSLRAALPDEALVVTDSGVHQVLARRYFEVRAPFGLLLPTDLQSMGFALPTAIAAKLAAPQRPVVALLGDGGALMSGLELAVAVREQLPLVAVVFSDGYLNQIRLQQLQDHGRAHGVALPTVDFAALAAAVGAHYELSDARLECLPQALASPRVTLIEVPVSDSAALQSAARRSRAKAVVRRAMQVARRPRLRR
jgi:acetolactate synthase I/II/III large subunit